MPKDTGDGYNAWLEKYISEAKPVASPDPREPSTHLRQILEAKAPKGSHLTQDDIHGTMNEEINRWRR